MSWKCCGSDQCVWKRSFDVLRPYMVGVGIGILSWIVFAVVNNPIGISTAVSQASGAVAEGVIGKEAVLSNPYWKQNVPRWDYGTLFLVGTFGGALLSAFLGRSFRIETVPEVWEQRFVHPKASGWPQHFLVES